MFNVGKVLEAAELGPQDSRLPDWAPDAVKANGGLWIRALIDQGADASPIAAQTHRLLKQGRVTQFSFAYDVIDGGRQTVDGEDAYELRKLKLYEASVTQVGANQDTTLLGVKDRPAVAAKAGRVLSAKNETAIRKAVELLSGVLAALDKDDAGNGEPAKDEEPDGAKSEELSHVDARLLADLGIAEVALLL
jgi:hypothetical protein